MKKLTFNEYFKRENEFSLQSSCIFGMSRKTAIKRFFKAKLTSTGV